MLPRVLEKNHVAAIAETTNQKKVEFTTKDLYKVNYTDGSDTANAHSDGSDQDLRLNSEIFAVLDKVTNLPLVKSLELRPPQVVVLGMESHGKSTLLERLIKLDVFPKGRNRCTSCIIRLQLRRGPAKLPVISIRNRATLLKSYAKELPTFEGSLVEEVRILMAMAAAMEGRLLAINHEVLISIQNEEAPNLDLVDLPGIVGANEGNKSEDLAQSTYSLAESVVENERQYSTFLLVVDVRTQVNNSLASKLIEEKGVEAQTIGVFTKLDMFQFETEDPVEENQALVDKLTNRTLLENNGWLACANRSPSSEDLIGREACYRFELMADCEARLLRTKPFNTWTTVFRNSIAGLPIIRRRVQSLFEGFLVSSWVPNIIKSVKREIVNLLDQYVSLGLPLCSPPPSNIDASELQSLLRIAESVAVVEKVDSEHSRSIFRSWSTTNIFNLAMKEILIAIKSYGNSFGLENFKSIARNETAQHLLTDLDIFNDLLSQEEEAWEQAYHCKEIAELARKGGRHFARHRNYRDYCSRLEKMPPPQLLVQNVIDEAKGILLSLVDCLCQIWTPNLLSVRLKRISFNAHEFEGAFKSGYLLNINKSFPEFIHALLLQIECEWIKAQTIMREQLANMIDGIDLMATLFDQTHISYKSIDGQRPNEAGDSFPAKIEEAANSTPVEMRAFKTLFQVSESAWKLPHTIVSAYLQMMWRFFGDLEKTLTDSMPESCFVNDEKKFQKRLETLRMIANCSDVLQTFRTLTIGTPDSRSQLLTLQVSVKVGDMML